MDHVEHGRIGEGLSTRKIPGTTAAGEAIVSSSHGTLALPADMVVLCRGSEPVDAPDDLERGDASVFIVGDALGPDYVTEAIAEAALAILEPLGMELSCPGAAARSRCPPRKQQGSGASTGVR
jgi:hypothetical protein